jgi:uncharacterized protein YjbI with pentapeptide repeats
VFQAPRLAGGSIGLVGAARDAELLQNRPHWVAGQDFRGLDLSSMVVGVDLQMDSANFSGVNFTNANFTNAYLGGSAFPGSVFTGSGATRSAPTAPTATRTTASRA